MAVCSGGYVEGGAQAVRVAPASCSDQLRWCSVVVCSGRDVEGGVQVAKGAPTGCFGFTSSSTGTFSGRKIRCCVGGGSLVLLCHEWRVVRLIKSGTDGCCSVWLEEG